MSTTKSQAITSAEGNGNRKEKDGKAVRRLTKKAPDEKTIIALLNRVCLHEEEEYRKIKASWLNACHESPAKGAQNCRNIRVACHEDMALANVPSSSSSSLSSSSPSSSSPDGKDKIEEMVSFGEICELLYDISKLPESLVRAQTLYCCRTALAHYNMVHRTHYELVGSLRSARSVGGWAGTHSRVGFHCNFTAAKLRKDNTPSRPKLFCATFKCRKNIAYDIRCCIVDPAEALHNNCVICPPNIAHCPCNRHRKSIFLVDLADLNYTSQDRSSANISLAWYNKKHGTAYKLVKPLRSTYRIEDMRHWLYHCNFLAKLKSPCDDDSPKLFFGEFMRSTFIFVLDCCILESAETLDSLPHPQSGLDDQCEFCPRAILHPPNYTARVERYDD